MSSGSLSKMLLRIRYPRFRQISLVGLMIALITSCSSEKGFRFEGRYEAPRSGYRIMIVSRGYVASGFDIADYAYARVLVCPLTAAAGKPFRFSLTKLPQAPQLFESEDMLTADATWSEKLLGAVLQARGYSALTAMELAGSFRVISNSLSGPKGVILQGQIDSVTVVDAKPEYAAADMKTQPQRGWVSSAELGTCAPVN